MNYISVDYITTAIGWSSGQRVCFSDVRRIHERGLLL